MTQMAQNCPTGALTQTGKAMPFFAFDKASFNVSLAQARFAFPAG
jgi:hypothetical protein